MFNRLLANKNVRTAIAVVVFVVIMAVLVFGLPIQWW